MFAKFGSVIAAIGLMAAMASVSHAQRATSAGAGEGVMAPAGQTQMKPLPQPPELTPQERRLREEELNRGHPPGPPLPGEPGGEPPLPHVGPTTQTRHPAARPLGG